MNIKLLKTKFCKFYVERVYLWLGPKNGVSPNDNVVQNCTETRIYSDRFARLMKLPNRPFRAKLDQIEIVSPKRPIRSLVFSHKVGLLGYKSDSCSSAIEVQYEKYHLRRL